MCVCVCVCVCAHMHSLQWAGVQAVIYVCSYIDNIERSSPPPRDMLLWLELKHHSFGRSLFSAMAE